MILNHVAQHPSGVVVAAAAFDPDRLGVGDLHVIDIPAVPYRLEYSVGKTKDQKVLNRLFPEVMVDAVDLILVEDLGSFNVQVLCALEVMAERLLDDNPGPAFSFRLCQICRSELLNGFSVKR